MRPSPLTLARTLGWYLNRHCPAHRAVVPSRARCPLAVCSRGRRLPEIQHCRTGHQTGRCAATPPVTIEAYHVRCSCFWLHLAPVSRCVADQWEPACPCTYPVACELLSQTAVACRTLRQAPHTAGCCPTWTACEAAWPGRCRRGRQLARKKTTNRFVIGQAGSGCQAAHRSLSSVSAALRQRQAALRHLRHEARRDTRRLSAGTGWAT